MIVTKTKKDEWLPYVKNDVLCTAFSYARYCEAMERITRFSMKDCLSAPGLGWKYFNSTRDENDEPMYTYNDKNMRWFVRQSIKGGRVCAFNQYYRSKICDDVLKILSEESNVNGNVYDIIEASIKYKNQHLKFIKKLYESKFNNYRDIDEEEKNSYINKKLSECPIQNLLRELGLNDFLWGFDGVSLYPGAMSDEKSNYPTIETGYAHTPDMNDELVEKFSNQTFTQGSAILKIKYYNLIKLDVQHIPIKEGIHKMEIVRVRNGYIVDTSTSVDIQEIVNIRGKVIKIYEVVFYLENFKVSTFKKVIDILFELRQKYKDENNDVMQTLVKLNPNSLYEEQIRKDIEESYQCKSEMWMMTEYDERVLVYQKNNYGNYFVKLIEDERLQDEV